MYAPNAAISTRPLVPSNKASRPLARVPFQPQTVEDPTGLTASTTPPLIIPFQLHCHKGNSGCPQSLSKCVRGSHSSVKRKKMTALRETPWIWMSTTILHSGRFVFGPVRLAHLHVLHYFFSYGAPPLFVSSLNFPSLRERIERCFRPAPLVSPRFPDPSDLLFPPSPPISSHRVVVSRNIWLYCNFLYTYQTQCTVPLHVLSPRVCLSLRVLLRTCDPRAYPSWSGVEANQRNQTDLGCFIVELILSSLDRPRELGLVFAGGVHTKTGGSRTA